MYKNKTRKKTDKNSDKKENKNKVRLSFIGGNANNVTGSCIIGSFKGFNFLLELGMVQGFSKFENYKENWNILNKIDFNKIDVVFVNHFHIDHSGLLSHIGTLKDFRGKVICTTETARMLKPLMEDSAKIIEDDCESIGGEHQMTYPNLNQEWKSKLGSIVIKEFSGIDYLPDDINELMEMSYLT